MEARFYTRLKNQKVKCHLCPHECTITPGHSGICKIRSNNNGVLLVEMYGSLAATHFDPIEKKPLYHFHPGSEILSLGSLGCNFHCSCCQNYEISQTGKAGFPRLQEFSVADIVKVAKSVPANIGAAYTYNEPMIWFEYMFDIALEIKKAGLKNVAVSNGYVNKKPLTGLIDYFDAFNIDIKSFDEKKHKEFTGGELGFVLDTLTSIISAGKHLEITFLLVPGINDDPDMFEKMVRWIPQHLGPDIPLHISRYFPRYKMTAEPTSLKIIHEMIALASRYLHYVYSGNIPGDNYQDTVCPGCDAVAIHRKGYGICHEGLDAQGSCINCGYKIAIT
jgi:pyruvate formate lyase activating enzyme